MMCCKSWGMMRVGLCCSEISKFVWPRRCGRCGVHYFRVCVSGLAHG